MEKATNLLKILDGYKSYIVGLISVGIGVYLKDINLIMLGLATLGLKSAIVKTGQN